MIISRSEAAVGDVEGIWLYVAQDSSSAADLVVERLDAAFRNLAQFPMMGVVRSDLAIDLRALRVDNLIIFYRALRDEVSVERVLHARMDATQIEF